MNRKSIYLILLLNILSIALVKSDCQSQLAQYINKGGVVQMTAVLRDGRVFYTRQRLLPFGMGPQPIYLTNGDPFNVGCSQDDSCVNSKSQPFAKPITSFFDAKGILIWPEGKVTMTPLWRVSGDSTYQFQLTCSPTSQVYYGFANENYFAFTFLSNSTTTGSHC